MVETKEALRDFCLREGMTVKELVEQMAGSWGFTAEKVVTGVDIIKRMLTDEHCTKFLSFPACIVATGTRGVLKEMVKRRLVDVIITTCGTLDHDLARCWKNYYRGSFEMYDKMLHQRK
ncbi:MAG: deoxyhypusine synthase family protein, partial [Candidatus Jordarchaeaceae archaeon]